MIVRLVENGEVRTVSPSEAKRLIESKQAVPVVDGDCRNAVVIEKRIESR